MALVLIVPSKETALQAGLNFLAELDESKKVDDGESISASVPSITDPVADTKIPRDVLILRVTAALQANNGAILVSDRYADRSDLLRRVHIKYVSHDEVIVICANLHILPPKYACIVIDPDDPKPWYKAHRSVWEPVALAATSPGVEQVVIVDAHSTIDIARCPLFLSCLVIPPS